MTMNPRIANGGLHCANCGHTGIGHSWEDIYTMGSYGPVDSISTGCKYLDCECLGFSRDHEKLQKRLI